MESRPTDGERPVTENPPGPAGVTLSNAMHGKLRVKPRRPRRKAKYSLATDSEREYREGKVKSTAVSGVKQALK